jgi:hypothetical protein
MLTLSGPAQARARTISPAGPLSKVYVFSDTYVKSRSMEKDRLAHPLTLLVTKILQVWRGLYCAVPPGNQSRADVGGFVSRGFETSRGCGVGVSHRA